MQCNNILYKREYKLLKYRKYTGRNKNYTQRKKCKNYLEI